MISSSSSSDCLLVKFDDRKSDSTTPANVCLTVLYNCLLFVFRVRSPGRDARRGERSVLPPYALQRRRRRSVLISSTRKTSDRGSRIPEPLTMLTSKWFLKVQISQGAGPCSSLVCDKSVKQSMCMLSVFIDSLEGQGIEAIVSRDQLRPVCVQVCVLSRNKVAQSLLLQLLLLLLLSILLLLVITSSSSSSSSNSSSSSSSSSRSPRRAARLRGRGESRTANTTTN